MTNYYYIAWIQQELIKNFILDVQIFQKLNQFSPQIFQSCINIFFPFQTWNSIQQFDSNGPTWNLKEKIYYILFYVDGGIQKYCVAITRT